MNTATKPSSQAAVAAAESRQPKSTLQHTFDVHNALRKERNPPTARYCALLAMALHGEPMTAHEISLAMGDDSPPGGTISSAIRHGFITTVNLPGSRGLNYKLTTQGIAEVARLMNPNPES